MVETSQPWDGTLGGDATRAPYSAQEWLDMYSDLFQSSGNKGILQGFGGELVVTGVASPVSVATGASLVLGRWHHSSTIVQFAISTPGPGTTRTDRIVVRSDYVAYTVRLVRLTGAGGGAEPALTQTPGVRWEIPLAKVAIDDAGVIILTDEREYCNPIADHDHAGVPGDGGSFDAANLESGASADGDVLTADGFGGAAWEAGGAGGVHDLLSVTHPDTDPDAVLRGDMIVGDSTPAWARLPAGAPGDLLTMGADDPAWTSPAALGDHDHAGVPGDGGQFDLDHLLSSGANADDVPLADGAGAITWGPVPAHTHTRPRTLVFKWTGTLAVATGALRNFPDGDWVIDKVWIAVNTAPTGANIIVDIHKNGVTIFTDQGKRPEIAVGNFSDESDTPDVTAIGKTDYLTKDIDQVGSTIPGEDLSVFVRATETV